MEDKGERGQEGGERRVRGRYCGGLEGMKGVGGLGEKRGRRGRIFGAGEILGAKHCTCDVGLHWTGVPG